MTRTSIHPRLAGLHVGPSNARQDAAVNRSPRAALPFVKMQGCGNDYIYINGFEHEVQNAAALARRMSHRQFGVGSDGLILILPPDPGVEADVRMRMWNSDGSEAEMCGNGLRCVAKFAHDRGLSAPADGRTPPGPMRVQTGRGILGLHYTLDDDGLVDRVTVDMGEPILEAAKIPTTLPGERIIDHPLTTFAGDWSAQSWFASCGLDPRVTCVSMGNPHAVLFCRDVGSVPLAEVAPMLEQHPVFPKRINVHFVEVHSTREVTTRPWERGAGATMACGTGASAVCVAGVISGRTDRHITARVPGGELELRWDEQSNHVFMTGPATEVYSGEFLL
jgi:diaminopimelate epimerase